MEWYFTSCVCTFSTANIHDLSDTKENSLSLWSSELRPLCSRHRSPPFFWQRFFTQVRAWPVPPPSSSRFTASTSFTWVVSSWRSVGKRELQVSKLDFWLSASGSKGQLLPLHSFHYFINSPHFLCMVGIHKWMFSNVMFPLNSWGILSHHIKVQRKEKNVT